MAELEASASGGFLTAGSGSVQLQLVPAKRGPCFWVFLAVEVFKHETYKMVPAKRGPKITHFGCCDEFHVFLFIRFMSCRRLSVRRRRHRLPLFRNNTGQQSSENDIGVVRLRVQAVLIMLKNSTKDNKIVRVIKVINVCSGSPPRRIGQQTSGNNTGGVLCG